MDNMTENNVPWSVSRYDGMDMVQMMTDTPVGEWERMRRAGEPMPVLLNGEPLPTDEDIAEIITEITARQQSMAAHPSNQ